MSDMPKAPSPSLQSMENRLCDILTLEDEIKVLEQKMVVLKAEMMGMIGKIEDATLQMVLVQCFLNMRSNTQASKDLHFARCWFIRLKNQALEAMEQVLSEKKGE